MNELIISLKKHVDEQEREYRKKKHAFEDAEKAYKRAVYDETHKKKLILAKNFVGVVEIVHKNNLRCVCMKGVDPQRDSDPYMNPCFTVQDADQCSAHITVQDGVVYGEPGEDFDRRWLDKLVYNLELFCESCGQN